jgi:PPOX class probable F420-dependent enzyme
MPVPELEARFPGKYVSVTTFNRDGTGVATPVWFVIEDGRLLIQTDPGSFKVKRIRRTDAVTIAPCSATGRPRGESMPARAELLPASQLGHVEKLLGRKYRIDRVLIAPVYRAVRRLRGAQQRAESVALAITPAKCGRCTP